MSGDELSRGDHVLSLCKWFPPADASGQLVEAGLLQLPVCVLYAAVLHPAAGEDGIQGAVLQENG